MDLDISRVRLIFTKDFVEVFQLVKEGKVDVGVMYNETWDQIENREDVKIIEDSKLDTHHIFMVHNSIYDKVKPVLLSFDEVEEATLDDVQKARNLIEKFEKFSIIWKDESIVRSIKDSPFIGVMIYRDKILYINDFVSKISGFSKEELIGMSIFDLVDRVKDENIKQTIKENIQKRLEGKHGIYTYVDLPFLTKNEEIVYLYIYSDTILYFGEYAGIVFVIDDTKRKKLENINNLLKEVNDAIIHSTFEEELFEKIADALVNKIGLKLVWIGKEKPDTKEIIPTFYKGEAIDYLKEIKISSREDIPEGQGITGRAYRENKYINPDSYSSDIMSPWREKLLKYELLSSVAIPITKGSKVEYVLTLYSSEKNFFKEEFLDILYELKKDIEFTLDKIESIKKSIIIGNAINYSKSWVIVTDEEGNITFINDFVSEISGYSKEELIGKNPRIFKSGYTPEFYTELWKKIKSGEPFTGIFVNRAKDGTTFTLEESIYPLKLPGGIVRYVSIGRDITREQQISSELTKLKFYDILTGLYNINGFSFRCNEEIKGDEYICLIFIDIPNFTDINKIYGFKVGNEILRFVADKLKSNFREGDIIGRIGNDEFGILVLGIKNIDNISVILEKLKKSLKPKLIIEGRDIYISVNGGVSVYPQDGKTFEDLYTKASLALKEAKREGSGVIKFYNKALEEITEKIKFAESLVLKALEKNLFVFFLQPYFRTDDLMLAGFEALVRIKDEDGKIYTPNFFIDYLENSEYIREFENWVLREAVRISRKFNIPISVNISAKSFSEDIFISKLSDIPDDIFITYEITERVFIKEFEKIKKFVEHITKKKNIKIAIDDFGTGYSSLIYLKELPANILKIDISFISTMLNSEKDKALVKTIIYLAKNLGLESLAEGVETQEQYDLLKNMGCNYVQGFLFGKPMPEEEAEKLLKP